MKEEAVKINRRIKESKVSVHPFYDEQFGEKIEIVKTSQFTKRVKDAAKQAGKAIKKGTKKATEQIKSFTKQDTTTIKVDQVAIAYISCCKQPN